MMTNQCSTIHSAPQPRSPQAPDTRRHPATGPPWDFPPDQGSIPLTPHPPSNQEEKRISRIHLEYTLTEGTPPQAEEKGRRSLERR